MTYPSDEQQALDEVAAALRPPPGVPDAVLAAATAAFTWRTVDAELAELLADAVGAAPGVRGGAPGVRSLTFQAGGSTLLLDITADGLEGQLVPPDAGLVVVRTGTALQGPFPVDELGSFRTPTAPKEAFRLVLRADDGRKVATGEISA